MSSGREVEPSVNQERSSPSGSFIIQFVAFFFRADPSASSHPTNPVDPDLQKGVNEVISAALPSCRGEGEAPAQVGKGEVIISG